jgi:FtsP/CotA-like multicopper oxidase with cupredoxin domain
MALDATYLNPIEWAGTMPMMNAASTSAQVQWVLEDLDTGAQNGDIRWTFQQGELVHLTLVNDRTSAHAMQHPFHIHGQRFQVVRMNGEPVEVTAWKDTIIVPTGSTVEVLVDMSNPGTWMMHCHIAEHLGSGMMGMFTVTPVEGMAAPWERASYH